MSAASAVFGAQHPEVRFELEHGGSGVGIRRFIEGGGLDFVNSSRPLKLAELDLAERHGRHLNATVVAAEALVVVVHPGNPLTSITREELADIYLRGTRRDWASLPGSGRAGPIHVLALDPSVSGTGEMFGELVGGTPGPTWSPGTVVLRDNPDVPEAVANDPDAIAFCSQSTTRGTALKVLEVEGVRPTEETVLDTSYVFNRRLYVVTDGLPRGLTADFLLFLLSEPGQRLARERGFTPVTLEVEP